MYKLGKIGALHHVAMVGTNKIVFKSLSKQRCVDFRDANNKTTA